MLVVSVRISEDLFGKILATFQKVSADLPRLEYVKTDEEKVALALETIIERHTIYYPS